MFNYGTNKENKTVIKPEYLFSETSHRTKTAISKTTTYAGFIIINVNNRLKIYQI